MAAYSKVISDFHQRAVTLLSEGKLDEAEKLYLQLIKLDPKFIGAYNNLGIIYRMKENLEKAKEYYRKTLELDPNYFHGFSNLANIFKLEGKFDEAEKYYYKAIKANPDFADAYNNLGGVLQLTGRLEQAADNYEKAIKLNPSYTDAYGNLGGVLIMLGRFVEAEACLRAVEKTSNSFEPLYNLANLLKEKGEFSEAVKLYKTVIKKQKNFTDAYNGLFVCLGSLCLWKEAARVYAKLQALSKRELLEGQRSGETPFTAITTSDDPLWNLNIAKSWSKFIEKAVHGKAPDFYFDRARKTHKKIRVGYLSGDFGDHPVGHIIKNMFAKHDKRRFEIYCFSFGGNSKDAIRKKIEKSVKYFVDISFMSFHDAAARIHAEEIDILVDLMGHTAANRLGIMAMRPCPVQISYLGFPGSIGADFIDYQIVDRALVPSGMEKYYKEQLIFMPDCYQINDSRQKISKKNFKRSDFGLPKNAFVFASFNRAFKITPKIFDVWMKALKDVPNSVLWLLSENKIADENLRKEAVARGIIAKRIIFSGMIPLEQHLKRLALADLMLDTYVYSGGATTSHAIRMGVPVVTHEGKTYLSRMTAALLTAADMKELITKDLVSYEKLIIGLAKDKKKLAALRKKLKKNISSSKIFDTREFVKNLEIAYQIAWNLYKSGRNLSSIELTRPTSRKPK